MDENARMVSARLRTLRAMVWVVCLALVAAPGRAQEARPGAISPALAGEKRLEKSIDLTAKDEALEDLLPRLGRELGLTLRTTRETRDLKVTLLYRQGRAVEILSRLAKHLDLDWNKRGGAYELIQSLRARQREADARDRELSETWNYALEVIRAAPEAARVPAAELKAQTEALRQSLANPVLDAAQRASAERRLKLLQDASQPQAAGVAALFGTLGADALRRLRSGETIPLSTSDATLPPSVSEAVRQLAGTVGSRRGVGAEDPAGKEEFQVSFSFGRLRHSNVSLAVGRRGPPGFFTAQVSRVRRSPGSASSSSTTFQLSPAPDRTLEFGNPDPAETGPLAQPITLKLPDTTTAFDARSIRLDTLLEQLRPQIQEQILSENFVRFRISERFLTGIKSLGGLLRVLRQELDLSYTIEGGVLALKSISWGVDRADEVPNRILSGLRSTTPQSLHQHLDRLAEAVSELDDDRLRSLQLNWINYLIGSPLGVPVMSGEPFDARYDLRFWKSLLPAQRASLLQSGQISSSMLNPVQQRSLLAAINSPVSMRNPFGGDLTLPRGPTEPIGAEVVLMMRQEDQLYRVQLRPDGFFRMTNLGTDSPEALAPMLPAGKDAQHTLLSPVTVVRFVYRNAGSNVTLRGSGLTVPQRKEKAPGM